MTRFAIVGSVLQQLPWSLLHRVSFALQQLHDEAPSRRPCPHGRSFPSPSWYSSPFALCPRPRTTDSCGAGGRGGLSWWVSSSLLRLARWTWPSSTAKALDPSPVSSRSPFRIVDMAILASTHGHDMASSPHGVGIASPSTGRGVSSPQDRAAARVGGVAGVAGPCVACVLQAGEVCVLRLSMGGVEELYRSAPAAVPVLGDRGLPSHGGRNGMLSVPSTLRHQFLLVAR